MIEPGCVRRRRAPSSTLPRVEPDVMMVPANGEKSGAIAELLGDVEPESLRVKLNRPFEVGYLEVYVTDSNMLG